MKARIWHNPRCSKSREALALLSDMPGIAVEVVDYLRDPPTAETLRDLLARGNLTPRDALRAAEPIARAQGLDTASDEAILAAMIADPILIERPIVDTPKGVVIARPADRIRTIV